MILIAFALYITVLLFVGWYGYTQLHSSSDFMLGGRNINYWVTAISAHASDMSGWLFFGFPAAVYLHGTTECWAAIGLLGGMWGTWHFIAPRLRLRTEQTNSDTIAHFFSHTSGDRRGIVSLVTAIAALFFFVFYLASGLKAVGTLLEMVFGIPYITGMMTSAFAIALYTMLGGYLAVALTDAFQGLFLLVMIALVPLVTAWRLPAEKMSSFLSETPLTLLPNLEPTTLFIAFTTALGWGIGYCGMPHVLSKFMGIDEVKNMKKAKYVGMAWQTVALSAACAIGLLARALYGTGTHESSTIFIDLVMGHFSPLLAGFVLCAVLAATISTVDAQLIVSATIITKDLLRTQNARAQVFATRVSIVLLTAIAVSIALFSGQSLHEIVRYAWSGLGSTFGPVVIASLYYKGLTPAGATSGMLAGAITAAVWPYIGTILLHAPMLPGFAAGFVTIFVVSALTQTTR
ncbi:MAG: sodium/proline symporter [Candidatus Dependentiae bacterium]|jgi:sodium/proline symporter